MKEQVVLELVEIDKELGIKLTSVACLLRFFNMPPNAHIERSCCISAGKVDFFVHCQRKVIYIWSTWFWSFYMFFFSLACEQFSKWFLLNVVHITLQDRCSLRCNCGKIGHCLICDVWSNISISWVILPIHLSWIDSKL